MLACIAVLPLIPATAHWWEKHSSQLIVAVGLGVPVAAWMWVALGWTSVFAAVVEYVQFICLLLALFVVSGGIFLKGDIRATPRNNTIFLAIGGVIASFVGTTGAAMLLIRPLLATNKERHYRVHTVLYTIFIVANCGGLLTPLGDPPLFLGFLRGVPFTWTFNLLREYLFVNVMLLASYYALDSYYYSQEPAKAVHDDDTEIEPLGLKGSLNFVFFAVIIEVRFKDNQFTWGPIAEVGILFIGIFLTMIPALHYLDEVAGSLPLNEVTFFIFTGGLSSVLDNAPTYATFFEMAGKVPHPGSVPVAGTGVPELYLVSISLGAVLCGAITYIGNGPNFMVKSVAESDGVEMPSFGGYVWRAMKHLVPIIAAMVLLFIAPGLLWKALGGVLTVGLLGRDALLLAQSRRLALADQAEDAEG